MHEKEGENNMPNEEKWSWDQRLSEEEDLSPWKVFREVKKLKGLREIERNESEIMRRVFVGNS